MSQTSDGPAQGQAPDATQAQSMTTSYPPTATTPGASSMPSTGSRLAFLPELSASTQMILERLRAGSSAAGSTGVVAPGYEDVRRSVLENMKTSISLEMPSTARMSTTPARARTSSATKSSPSTAIGTTMPRGKLAAGSRGRKSGRKRKRNEDETDEESSASGEHDTESDGEEGKIPRMTKSGRQVTKPLQYNPASMAASMPSRKRGSGPGRRNQEQALCKRCGRGYSPQTNMIVFCDGCNLGWHQMCHDPSIPNDVVKEESKEWLCTDCRTKRERARARTADSRRTLQDKGLEEKRAYLSSFSHQDLVSILLQATILHPDLPLLVRSQQELAKLTSKHSATRQSPASKETPRPGSHRLTSDPSSKLDTPAALTPQIQPQVDADNSRDSTPASPPYPKPGSGLMAKLPPDDQDLEWLVDDGDFTAFSHIVYDKNGHGQKIEENGVLLGTSTM